MRLATREACDTAEHDHSRERAGKMANKKLVLGLFADEAAADTAVESLKAWDKLDDDVKLHHITVMALDEDGKLKASNLPKARASGAAAGFGSGLVMVILLGPVGPVFALPVIGGILGALHRPGLGLDKHERDRIAGELEGGKAALGVLVKHDDEAVAVSAKLAELGGVPETHEVSPEVEAAAEQAAEEADKV